ncbi:adhesion G-protein coupled receptor G2 isoform X1 [Lates calcarifer]|uniref:Adhesion G-protein coupled receptor G2 isoform X1 n=1 Tax=Lates calcarifer TaxID=8187 RepID=A0AAJ7V6T0_LATCA|nr:adhesion G-protein coupled receptor G2 isoform X1 [Lates calcarifer]
MSQKSWMKWVLLVGLLWIFPACVSCEKCQKKEKIQKREERQCLVKNADRCFLVADNFNGFITTETYIQTKACIMFLQKNGNQKFRKYEPVMDTKDGSYLLYISKWHIVKKLQMYFLNGTQCNNTVANLTGSECVFNQTSADSDLCQVRCLHTETICKDSVYDESFCSNDNSQVEDRYIINMTATNKLCKNCNNPVKIPKVEIQLNTTVPNNGKPIDADEASKVMSSMAELAASINESSVALSAGEGVTGILVKETQPEDVQEVSFAYISPNDSISIIEDRDSLSQFSRSVTVTKEAFEKAVQSNISVPFAAVFRFINMAPDEFNSTVLGNEVLAVEMGTSISNLTDTINVNFWNTEYKGIPSCHSWNGEGSRPNWTEEGCLTVKNGSNITCQCSHLTFFAILLTPLNETISSSDLSNLTIITQVGCGLSIFFLSIVLFMHFLIRKTKATKSTRILIHLVSAMLLLNFTFLINNFVAKLKSSVGCKIMAALMHYFMLATFTWFAAQAFHICLQLYTGGQIAIHRYILKVSIVSWCEFMSICHFLRRETLSGLDKCKRFSLLFGPTVNKTLALNWLLFPPFPVTPSLVGIVLLIIGKYGEQIIYTDDPADNVAMCWITDNDVHYIVNIGYYSLVFLFTFTSFIITLSWLFCLRKAKAATQQVNRNGKSIVTIMGLCCMLGITWGFAFFAYGIFLIPSYYIFTVLNSFQGFFLFIYYYKSSHSGETNSGKGGDRNLASTSSVSTLKTGLDLFENPYCDPPNKK